MNVQAILTGVIPSLGVALLFFFVIRGVIRADRNERAAIAADEARAAHPTGDVTRDSA